MRLHELGPPQREVLLEETLRLFLLVCRQEFQTVLYPYQIRVARALLRSLLVSRADVFIKIARQSGKTEAVTLVLKFLMVFLLHLRGRPLMAGIASPNGEQAKTDVDRLKKSILHLNLRWGLEDRENNAQTIRAYRHDRLHCETYMFSLAPTTSSIESGRDVCRPPPDGLPGGGRLDGRRPACVEPWAVLRRVIPVGASLRRRPSRPVP